MLNWFLQTSTARVMACGARPVTFHLERCRPAGPPLPPPLPLLPVLAAEELAFQPPCTKA